MAMNKHIAAFEKSFKKKEVSAFRIGDTVRVLTRIVEGEKERIQAFQGIVISRKGVGVNETFTVHRLSYGIGVDRIFYIHSPRLTEIQVIRSGAVRKAKLYYLIDKKGKSAKVHQRLQGVTAKSGEGASSTEAVLESETQQTTA